MSKECKKCGWVLGKLSFNRDSSSKDGLRSECRECKRKYRLENREKIRQYSREYYQQHKKEAKEYNRRYRKNNREKKTAHDRVKYALRTGKIKKQPCACGCEEVEAHHENYSHPLEIKWICVPCHNKLHSGRKPNGKDRL